jgi:hypothetical protein
MSVGIATEGLFGTANAVVAVKTMTASSVFIYGCFSFISCSRGTRNSVHTRPTRYYENRSAKFQQRDGTIPNFETGDAAAGKKALRLGCRIV